MQPDTGIKTRLWSQNGKNAHNLHPLFCLVLAKAQLGGQAPEDGSADTISFHAPQLGQRTSVKPQQPL